MRIGLIAPPWVAVPPPAYGGTEIVVDNLARCLQRLGHEVYLFTVGDSTCPVPRRHLYTAAAEPMGSTVPESAHVLAAYDELAGLNLDVIHDHTMLGPLLAGRHPDRYPPIVTTNHGPFTAETKRLYTEMTPRVSIVAISHDQASSAGDVPVRAVIHHGVDLDVYRPGQGRGGYLLFVGRMAPDKGVHIAIRAARQARLPLRIVTKMREPAERAYYESVVAPLLAPEDAEPQELPRDQRVKLMQEAMALLNPIVWPEPFGLVMIEALATGTPVITFPNGAAPEIVKNGISGFLCAAEDELAKAIADVDTISRARCRQEAERHFSIDRMAREYERVYRAVQANGRQHRVVTRRTSPVGVGPSR